MPIRELRLAPLIEDYLAYVQQAGRDVAQRLEWIEMATVLIRWKSRLLLPRKPKPKTDEPAPPVESNPEEQPQEEELRQDLIQQLLGRARELAGTLRRRREGESRCETPSTWPDLWEPDAPVPEVWSAPSFSAWDVIQQAKALRDWVRRQQEEQRERDRNALRWPEAESSVEEMRAWLEERLQAAPPDFWLSAEPLFAEAGTRARQCFLFLALLELARANRLTLTQPEEFATLYVFPLSGKN